MPSLKGILFNQFASEGVNHLIEEMQQKYKPKKGRRFNHADITYEISRPTLLDNRLGFEISSKIPQDEVTDDKAMDTYFDKIKKILNANDLKPVSIERENIVWDSKKDTEKERDYVKCQYSYPLEDLYKNDEIIKRYEALQSGASKPLPEIAGVFTVQGKLALIMVQETVQGYVRDNVQTLIDANKKVRDGLKG
ncbi:hypothetical protein [Nitrospina watsonii]|uniref:Uncharacterized protein n=1 Tax=Nitrospina watsonii TaxID=1323948 RepID=A0ABN8VYU9_9BACT|nr:hypothetical protein [Nitrospina watsonii]CAI2718942.1 conserved protein of unknown function [Nitrospina watsonii]